MANTIASKTVTYFGKKQDLLQSNVYIFFYKQSIFDPRPENCLSFSKKLAQKIV